MCVCVCMSVNFYAVWALFMFFSVLFQLLLTARSLLNFSVKWHTHTPTHTQAVKWNEHRKWSSWKNTNSVWDVVKGIRVEWGI